MAKTKLVVLLRSSKDIRSRRKLQRKMKNGSMLKPIITVSILISLGS